VWVLLALLCTHWMRSFRPLPLSNDSYQYLNVADNVNHAHGVATSLVHFDTERSHGRIPAPLTTFPPAYPVVLAATSDISGSLEGGARLVSGICYAGTAGLLIFALMLAGVTAFVRQMILCVFCANAVNLEFSAAVLTEPLYMLISTAAVVALLWVEALLWADTRSQETLTPTAIAVAVLAYVLSGLAYWIRYAGLFLIVAVVGFALLQFLLHRNRTRAFYLAGAFIPIVCAGGLMLRNIHYVGTWKGGNDIQVHNALKALVADYARAQLHLALGQHQVIFGIWETMLLVGGLGVFALLIAGLKSSRPLPSNSVTLLVLLCVVVYSAGMFYAGLRTVISFGTRMFLPILPLYLILLGVGGSWLMVRWARGTQSVLLKAGFLLATFGYVGINARDLYEPTPPAEHEILAKQYAEPTSDGQPLLKWVDSNMAANDAVAAAEGQATGYLLHRPTMSLVGSQYSREHWECDEVKNQMKRFGAHYLILYKPPASNIDEQSLLTHSHFVATAVSGQPPCGFVIATENPDIRILRIDLKSGIGQK
jgi:hypothetical protein